MHTKLLSSTEPGLIILMIDQSSSMAEPYSATQNKAEFAALAVNKVIAEIIERCSHGETIKDRVEVAAIGYGSKAKGQFVGYASELAENQQITKSTAMLSDGKGAETEIDVPLQVWLNPVASGSTAMADAFELAKEGALKWLTKNEHSFPPVVINITDGEPDEWQQYGNFDESTKAAKELMKIETTNGPLILLNAHISADSDGKIELPSSNSGFENNQFANFLFDISTVLSDPIAEAAKKEFSIKPEARGFLFNADGKGLMKLLNFGSRVLK
ncbi:MAG: hypothetical protein COB85_09655 [Bacteroidetes bacterium]|nr:MAG: hypothetical protein COB85_09655 [Bacteroidota bacterium]